MYSGVAGGAPRAVGHAARGLAMCLSPEKGWVDDNYTRVFDTWFFDTPFGMVSGAPGAAQTPNIDDF